MSDDPELRRAKEELNRKLEEIENDDGPRESEAERQAKQRNPDDHPDKTWTTRVITEEVRRENPKMKENVRTQRDRTG